MFSFTNDSNAKILNPSNNFDPVALASYPGTEDYDFIRYVIETISGIATGSDSDITGEWKKISKSGNLSDKSFLAEGIVDKRVWVISTRYPSLKSQEFEITKAILLVRNPLKIIEKKYFQKIQDVNRNGTKIHSNLETNEAFFSSFLASESENFRAFMNFWLGQNKIPIYIVRVEDFISETANCLKNIFCFLLNSESLRETVVESKILTFFKFNKNLQNFIEEYESQNEYIMEYFTNLQKNLSIKTLREELIKLGYVNEIELGKLLKEKKFIEEMDLPRITKVKLSNEMWFIRSNHIALQNQLRNYAEKANEDLMMSSGKMFNQKRNMLKINGKF